MRLRTPFLRFAGIALLVFAASGAWQEAELASAKDLTGTWEGPEATCVAGIPPESQAARSGAPASPTPTPEAELYLEGTLVQGETCLYSKSHLGWSFLLFGDVEGFNDGDQVGIWGSFCDGCFSLCWEPFAILEVKGIVRLGTVGGIAELPEVDGTVFEATNGSSGDADVVAGLVAAAILSFGALVVAGAWHARRRRAKHRPYGRD